MISYNNGFIALFSVIIVSFILLLAAVSLSFSGFFARFNILDSELKARSDALAEGCLEAALLELAKDNTHLGGDTIGIDDETCNYEISPGGIVQAWAQVGAAHTNYRIEVNLDSLDIIFLEELSTLP